MRRYQLVWLQRHHRARGAAAGSPIDSRRCAYRAPTAGLPARILPVARAAGVPPEQRRREEAGRAVLDVLGAGRRLHGAARGAHPRTLRRQPPRRRSFGQLRPRGRARPPARHAAVAGGGGAAQRGRSRGGLARGRGAGSLPPAAARRALTAASPAAAHPRIAAGERALGAVRAVRRGARRRVGDGACGEARAPFGPHPCRRPRARRP